MVLIPNQRTVDLIKRFEGLRLEPYHDDAGYPTVGYGHLLSRKQWDDLSRYPTLTEPQADAFLMSDILHAMYGVAVLTKVPLNPNQLGALTSFAFNLGTAAYQRSTLRSLLNQGEYQTVPQQLSRWVYAGGRKLNGLIRRRQAEAALFMEELV